MDDLLIKYILGETTPQETTRVREWLSNSEANRQRLEQFRAVWKISAGGTPKNAVPGKHEAWQRVRQKISAGTANGTGTAIRPDRYRVWKAAAILTGLVALGVTAYVLTRHPSIAVAAASQKVPVRASRETTWVVRTEAVKDDASNKVARKKDLGWRKVVADDAPRIDSLPDGSVVQLNPGAAITYPESFQGHRTIRLEGDASFDVTHDAAHPFIVQTQDITIKVLGTSFHVFSRAGRTSVIMRTGVTRVIRGKDSALLHACEGIVAVNGEKGFRDTIPGNDTSQMYPPKKTAPAHLPKTGKPAKMEVVVRDVQKGWQKKKSPCDVDVQIIVPGKVATTPGKPVKPLKKLPSYDAPSVEESKQTVRSIIGELVAARVVADPRELRSFSLERQRFFVNDQPMPDSLASRFRSLYIHPDGPNLYYGPVKVIGRGIFLDKKDIYP